MVQLGAVVRKYWWVLALAVIVIFGAWVRTGAMRYSDLPDIDTYYFLRLNEYVLSHNFQMPQVDMMRNWPYGEHMFDLPVNFYLPSAMYVALNPLLNISFYRFAFVQPVILAAIGMILMFFLANELFGDRKKALLSAFFFAALPAAITRLSAGEIEKEANSVVFLFLTLIFFLKAYKSENWKWKGLAYGIISGIFMGVMSITWGGAQFIHLLLSMFALVLLLINKPERLWYSFIPTVIIGIGMQQVIIPQFTTITSTYALLASMAVSILIITRIAAQRFSLIKQESLKFFMPGIVILAGVALLIASMFSDYVNAMLGSLVNMITLYQPGLTTVAESIPGNWNAIVQQTSVAFSQGMLPQLSTIGIGPLTLTTLLSAWFLMLLGAVVMAYKFVRYREYILLLPVVFLGISIFGVFYALRLAYFLGFSAALSAGYFCGWLTGRAASVKTIKSLSRTSLAYLITSGFFGMAFILSLSNMLLAAAFLIIAVSLAIPGYAMRVESHESWIKRLWLKLRGVQELHADIIMIPVAVFVMLLVTVNAANAYVFGGQLGPSINPYINEAMKFLREQTPENSSVLSWWDFGYWFQAVGKRPTIVDGGGAGNTSRYDVAIWFTDNTGNWSNWLNWLNNKLDVGYILMDYTLPGKYGAITKIASHETTVVGILQFEQIGSTPQGNNTIYEFGAGPYRIWLPIGQGGNVAGTPIFLMTDGTRYSNKAYINDLCTTGGIVNVGNESQTIGGCIAIYPQMGLFYVPEEAKNTIFTSLMFMDGAGLTGLEKVFDNGLVHIYDLKNTTH